MKPKTKKQILEEIRPVIYEIFILGELYKQSEVDKEVLDLLETYNKLSLKRLEEIKEGSILCLQRMRNRQMGMDSMSRRFLVAKEGNFLDNIMYSIFGNKYLD